MKKIDFKPKADIEEYFNESVFNLELFEELTFDENLAFEPLSFFNLLYNQFETLLEGKNKPFTALQNILKLGFDDKEMHFFLSALGGLYYEWYVFEEGEDQKLKEFFENYLEEERSIISDRLHPIEQPPSGFTFFFEETEKQLATIPNIEEKIKHLIDQKYFFIKNKDKVFVSETDFPGLAFDKQCDLEIKKLREMQKVETVPENLKEKTTFKLSTKTGARTDLIRILNALYELGLIVKQNEQIPTKEEFMIAFGCFLGIDLKNYSSNLSQSLKEQPLEINLQVFNKMIDIVTNMHYSSK